MVVPLMWVLLYLYELLVLYLVSVDVDYGLDARGAFTVSFLMAQGRVEAYGIQRGLVLGVVYLGSLPESLEGVEVRMLDAAAGISLALGGVIRVEAATNATIGLEKAVGLRLSECVVAVMKVSISLILSPTNRRITKLHRRNSLQSLGHIRRSLKTHPLHKNIRKLHILTLLLRFLSFFIHIGIQFFEIVLLFLV